MREPRNIVIVGAGLAGAKAAETLRDEGYEGGPVLAGEEHERPCERPPLSKDHLRGEVGLDKVYVHDAGFYEDRAIELRTESAVTAIDTAGCTVTLADGERLPWDRLLLATGSEPRRPGLPGTDLDDVLYLRTLVNSERLRGAILRTGGRPVVVGAGWIGSEAAASAPQLGMEVTLLERMAVPLENVPGPTVGRLYADLHGEHGVDFPAAAHDRLLGRPRRRRRGPAHGARRGRGDRGGRPPSPFRPSSAPARRSTPPVCGIRAWRWRSSSRRRCASSPRGKGRRREPAARERPTARPLGREATRANRSDEGGDRRGAVAMPDGPQTPRSSAFSVGGRMAPKTQSSGKMIPMMKRMM